MAFVSPLSTTEPQVSEQPDQPSSSSRALNVVVWANCPDDDNVRAALDYVRRFENVGKLMLVVSEKRAPALAPLADETLLVGGFREKTMTRLARRLWLRKIDLNVIACGNDFNHYQTVRKTINYAFAFKPTATVAVHYRGELLKFPIEIQQQRTRLALPLLALAAFSTVAPLAAAIIAGLGLAGALADIAFRIYMDRVHHVYYWVHLSFQREEMPYVTHGWTRPFGESYYNRMVTSREGAMRSGYNINTDAYPIFDPVRAHDDLPALFHFVNTHDKPLDDCSRSIFVLGGSVAQGLLNDPDTYSVRLEEHLKTAGHLYQVVPWALGGFVSTQSRLLVEMSLVERQPFAVVNLDFYNDCHYMIMGVLPGDTHRTQRKLVAEMSFAFRTLSPLFSYSAIARHIWQNIYSRMVERHMASLMETPEKLELGIRKCVTIYLRNIQRIHALCAHEGIHHRAFIQPFRDDLRSDGDAQEINKNRKAVLMNRCYQELARQLAEQPDLADIVTTEPVLSSADYCDEVHFTPEGQDKMAQTMLKGILPWCRQRI
jgi:hypothetical protein